MSSRVTKVAICSPYALDVFGGVQEQTLAMSRTLESRGIRVLVVAPASRGSADFETPATVRTFAPVTSVPANGSRAPLALSPLSAWRASEAIEAFSPDVVHLHEPFAPLLAYRALRRHRAPTVGTFHRAGSGPAYTYTRALLRWLSQGLDDVVAVSASAASTLHDEVGLRADVAFNGFETERFREFPRSTVEGRTNVLFVGRLEERKGVLSVLEAARVMTSDAPDWRFTIAGDGPLRAEVQRRANEIGSVDVLGAVSDETKRRLLRRADVVVAASIGGESFGMVILEPMAAEAPVVVSDIDGYREAAAGHGVLYSPGDAHALVTALRVARRDVDADAIAAARAHAERWSMSALMDLYGDHYERAVLAFRAAR